MMKLRKGEKHHENTLSNHKGWEWHNKIGYIDAANAYRDYDKPYRKTISILYYAKMDSNIYIWRQNSEKWMKDFLGEIDTPAELAVVLHTHRGTKRYKKIPKGYQIRIDNLITEQNAPDGRCMHIIRHAIVDKKGEIEPIYKSDRSPLDREKCARLRKKIEMH